MEQGYLLSIDQLVDLLHSTKINYVAVDVFAKQQLVVTYCNNQKWYNYCLNNYGLLLPVGVKKHIFSSKLNIINWNLLTLAKQDQAYIQRRNAITRINTSISLLYYIKTKLVVFTFGSKSKDSYLINFSKCKVNYLYLLAKQLIT